MLIITDTWFSEARSNGFTDRISVNKNEEKYGLTYGVTLYWLLVLTKEKRERTSEMPEYSFSNYLDQEKLISHCQHMPINQILSPLKFKNSLMDVLYNSLYHILLTNKVTVGGFFFIIIFFLHLNIARWYSKKKIFSHFPPLIRTSIVYQLDCICLSTGPHSSFEMYTIEWVSNWHTMQSLFWKLNWVALQWNCKCFNILMLLRLKDTSLHYMKFGCNRIKHSYVTLEYIFNTMDNC